MTLKHECMRDLMLCLQERLGLNENGTGIKYDLFELMQTERMQGYELEDIFYTIQKLHEGGFICAFIEHCKRSVKACYVQDITYEGHRLLQNIGTQAIWESAKAAAAAADLESVSVEILSELAEREIRERLGLV